MNEQIATSQTTIVFHEDTPPLVRHRITGVVARVLNITPDPFWFDFFGGEPETMYYVSPDCGGWADYWLPMDCEIVTATAWRIGAQEWAVRS